MSRLNENYLKLPGSYLFAEIADRVASFKNEKPDADVISLGIGDVTKPLVPAVVEAIHKAADEMGQEDTFRGYGPYQGYDFLAEKIIKHDFNRYGIELSTDEIFISDGAKSDCANFQEIFGQEQYDIREQNHQHNCTKLRNKKWRNPSESPFYRYAGY